MTQEGKEEADIAKEPKSDVQVKNPEKSRRGCAVKVRTLIPPFLAYFRHSNHECSSLAWKI